MTPESLSAMHAETHGEAGAAALDIERLEGLLAKATPGPWRFDGDWYRIPSIISGWKIIADIRKTVSAQRGGRTAEDEANAALIVEAVNALPALLAIAKAHLAKPCRPYGHDMSGTPLLDRLRMWIQPSHKPYPTHQMNPDGNEAAAEIEALRAEVGRLRAQLCRHDQARLEELRRQKAGWQPLDSHGSLVRPSIEKWRGEVETEIAALENRHG